MAVWQFDLRLQPTKSEFIDNEMLKDFQLFFENRKRVNNRIYLGNEKSDRVDLHLKGELIVEVLARIDMRKDSFRFIHVLSEICQKYFLSIYSYNFEREIKCDAILSSISLLKQRRNKMNK